MLFLHKTQTSLTLAVFILTPFNTYQLTSVILNFLHCPRFLYITRSALKTAHFPLCSNDVWEWEQNGKRRNVTLAPGDIFWHGLSKNQKHWIDLPTSCVPISVVPLNVSVHWSTHDIGPNAVEH